MFDSIVIFGLDIPLYGLFFYLGISLAAVVAVIIVRKRKIPLFDFVCSAVYACIGGLLGAKLLFVLVSIDQIIEYNVPLLSVIKGGFVFYGGLLGGLLGLWIYAKQFKESVTEYFDIYAIALPLGHAVGRVGCFFAGCCYGLPWEHGYVYTETVGNTPIGIPLFPIQLAEAFFLLILFVIQLIALKKIHFNGINTYIYFFAYPILRFILEFFRGDSERGTFVYLSTSQWISLIIIAIVVILAVNKRKKLSVKGDI